MESARLLFSFSRRHHRILRNARFLRSYSTENQQAHEVITQEKISLTNPSPTKWKRPPFMKSLFLGKFDTELMSFPEILDKAQVAELESSVKIISDIMTSKANSSEIDENQKLPDDLLQDLKDLGLFGRMIPEKYGGLGLCHTAVTRLNEALSLDWSTSATLAAHESFATQIFLQFGNEEQKTKYLPLLASGRLVAGFCLTEFHSGGDPLSIKTEFRWNPDKSVYINGSKAWVTNAEFADIFIVFAKEHQGVNMENNDISAFIVERESSGLKVSPQNKICLRGSGASIMQFEDVHVPSSNIIGTPGMGFLMYLKGLESLRIAINSVTFGTLKALLDVITQHIIDNERVGRSLGDQQLVRQKLSRINCRIYAMESMSYFLAGILDSTENPDVMLESAALKVFNSRGTLFCLREMQDLVGATGLMQELPLERFYRDALGISKFDGSNDVSRLFIGLNGIREAASKKHTNIEKMRNRFFHPMDAFKEVVRRIKIHNNTSQYDQDIAGHLHPSLVEWGNKLELDLNKFEVTVESVLISHGAKVIETQVEPLQLANIAIDMFAIAAVLSRSSRSYCEGLKNAHHEIKLAGAFCHDTHARIYRTLYDMSKGIGRNNEGIHLYQGEQIIDCKGYFAEHPLKHNY